MVFIEKNLQKMDPRSLNPCCQMHPVLCAEYLKMDSRRHSPLLHCVSAKAVSPPRPKLTHLGSGSL